MQLKAFWPRFGFLVSFYVGVNSSGPMSGQGYQNSSGQCSRDQVYCQPTRQCVDRLGFNCGNDSCASNERLCGPPSHKMNCVPSSQQCTLPDAHGNFGDHNPSLKRNNSLPSKLNESLSLGKRDRNVSHVKVQNRRRSQDDANPFSAGGPRNSQHDFERNETSNVLNDSRLRIILGKSFSLSMIDEIIGQRRHSNMTHDKKDNKNQEACNRRYSLCIRSALANLMLFKDLDGECCRITKEPLQFVRRLRNITRKFIDCPPGSRFSPFSFIFKENGGCIPMNYSDDHVLEEDRGASPKNRSKKEHSFCEILKRNIHDKTPFSSRRLVRWLVKKGKVSLSTKHCPKGKKFCPSSFDCRSKEHGCHTGTLTKWASKNLCNSSERLCLGCGAGCHSKKDECPKEANMSKALRQAALSIEPGNIQNETMRILSKSGWASFCFVRKALLTCILEQLKDCMSREVHCRETGYESHMSCLSGESFCQKIVDVACPFYIENCHLCNLLRKNASRFEKVIKNRSTQTPFGGNCSEGEVYCPTSMGCVPKGGLSNCTTNRQFFQLGMEKAPWDKNKKDEDNAGFCMLTMSPARNGSCSFGTWLQWQARQNKSCSPFGLKLKCCPKDEVFSVSAMKCVDPQDKDQMSGQPDENAACKADDQEFCPRQHECLPKHFDCTTPTKFHYFSVSVFANRSGWAGFCKVLGPFTARLKYGLKKCRQFLSRSNETCRAEINCKDEEQFCRRLGRCAPRGNCSGIGQRPSQHRKPTPSQNPLCNSSDQEVRMLWSKEPLKNLFPARKVAGLIGLFAVGDKYSASLEFKSEADKQWEPYMGCDDDQMRVVSTNSALRIKRCAHGFLSFEIEIEPRNSAHGSCVSIPASARQRDIVVMVLMPNCAIGLDINLVRPNIILREDHSSQKEQFSKYINVTSRPTNCSELKLDKSLACRVPKKFVSLYNQAVKQLQQRIPGMVITKMMPLKKVRLKCSTKQFGKLYEVTPNGPSFKSVFFAPYWTCVMVPSPNMFGNANLTLAPACRLPAHSSVNLNEDKPAWLKEIPQREYNNILRRIEDGRIDEAIEELLDRLQKEGIINLKRKVINFVRSFIAPDEKGRCVGSPEGKCRIGSGMTQLQVKVLPINDRPRFLLENREKLIPFPPVEENFSKADIKCWRVGNLTKMSSEYVRYVFEKKEVPKDFIKVKPLYPNRRPFTLVADPDDSEVGLAVLHAPPQKYVTWKFRIEDGPLKEINLTSGVVLLLGPNDCIALKPRRNVSWTKDQSRQSIFLLVKAYDNSDSKSSGYYEMNFTAMESDTTLSRETVKIMATQLGCDNVAWSRRKRDKCNQCPKKGVIKNNCLGCDKIPYSNKKRDECQICGNKTTSFCSEICWSPSHWDECNVCQSNDKVIDFKDCNGDCYGKAKWSDCNAIVCVGGNTKKPLHWGKDECGVCGGDNSTCVDCEGVPRGNKTKDSCGNCADPQDEENFDKCPKILDCDFRAIPSNQQTLMTLRVAGMAKHISISCYLYKDDGSKYDLTFVKALSKKKVIVKTPTMGAGEYSLNCSFGESKKKLGFDKFRIQVYGEPTINEASPNEIEINTKRNVTLKGTGFVKISSLACTISKEKSEKGKESLQKIPALYVNLTTIICVLKRFTKAQHGKISVLFAPGAENEKLSRDIAVQFNFYDRVPRPLECRFSRSTRFISIRFDRLVACTDKWESGERFITGSTLEKITKASKARCKNKKLIISLPQSSKLRPGEEVELDLKSFKSKWSSYTKHFPSDKRNVTCNLEDGVSLLVEISGPKKVGRCNSFVISAHTSMPAKMNWTVALVNSPAVYAEHTAADIQELNSRFANLPLNQTRIRLNASDVIEGAKYNITVCAQELLTGKMEMACDSIITERVGEEIPQIKFAKAIMEIGPSRTLRLRANVRASSCAASDMRYLSFIWSCDDPNIEFDDSSPVLEIKDDQWTSGRKYEFTLTVYVKGDDNLFSEDKITIMTRRVPIVAKIKGGENVSLSVHQGAVCDGSDSKDPNNLQGNPLYVWMAKCKEGDQWYPTFYENKTSGKVQRLILPRTAVVRIPPNTFTADKTCALTLNYYKDDMNATASVYYELKGREIPEVKMLRIIRILTSNKVIFRVVLKTKLPEVTVKWSCKERDDEGNMIDIDLEDFARTRSVLIIKKRPNRPVIKQRVSLVLKNLPDGIKLRCRCHVSHEEVEAFVEEELHINEPPLEGTTLVEKSEDGKISLTGQGFEDPEGEDLSYRCGYIEEGEKTKYHVISSWSMDNTCEDVLLPKGEEANNYEVKCFVEAKDLQGAKTLSECSATVLPRDSICKAEEIASEVDDLKERVSLSEIPEATAELQLIAQCTDDSDNGSSEAVKEGLKEAAKGLNELMVERQGKSPDPDGDAGIMRAVEVAVDAAKKGNAEINVQEISGNVREMNSPHPGESDLNPRRKRRAADDGSSEGEEEEVMMKAADEVETVLSIYDTLIDPKNFTEASMSVKRDLVSLVDELGRSMCKGISTGEEAVIAESNIVVIRTQQDSFDDVDVNFTHIACENCSSIQISAQVLLGQALKDLYQSWDCDEDGCNGACIVSAQYPHDLLATSNNRSYISDVIYVKLFDPENAAHLPASDLTEAVTFKIPLHGYSEFNDTFPMCHVWNHLTSIWTAEDITTGATSQNGNGKLSVECQYHKLGFIAVFAVNSSIQSAQTSSSKPVTVSSQPLTMSSQHVHTEKLVYIHFKFDANFEDIIPSEDKKTEFIETFTQYTADAMSVNKSRIADVVVRPGSILVSFTLLPGGPGENSVSMAMTALKDQVISGNFSFILADGQKLVADPASFLTSSTGRPSTVSTPQPIKPTTTHKEPIETSKNLSTSTLVSIIVGSVVGVILIIAVVIVIRMRKRKGKEVKDISTSQLRLTISPGNSKGHDNRGMKQENSEEYDQSNQFPMMEFREEVDLPGTPYYPDHR